MFSPTRRYLLSALAAVALTACSPDQPKFNAIDITGADYAKGFTLSDHTGQVRSLSEFKGKVVVLFFGYTQCPDVCPTSMTELAEVKKLLGKDGAMKGGFGLAVEVVLDPVKADTRRGPGSFGWGGAFGTYYWVDPHNDLVGLLMVQTPADELRPDFVNAVAQAIVE